MNDFICIDLKSNLENNQIIECILKEFSQFKWHQGDSETQGTYITGKNKEGVQVKFWLDEHPIAASISFRHMYLDAPIKEAAKYQIFQNIVCILMQHIGSIVRIKEY